MVIKAVQDLELAKFETYNDKECVRVKVENTAEFPGGGSGGGGPYFKTNSKVMTAVDDVGTTLNASTGPVKSFALQVKQTGVVDSWTVVLEASLDNTNFQTVLTHTKADQGDGKIQWTGSQDSPALYFRSKCTELTLGAGTNVTATVLGLS